MNQSLKIEKDEMKILIIGDVHGNWTALNHLLSRIRPWPALVLQAGDFGYFPNSVYGGDRHGAKRHRPYNPRGRVKLPEGTQLHWCDGNHEDQAALARLVAKHGHDEPIKVAQHCLYQPRGSHITLDDGRTVLFLGGSFSVDHRINPHSGMEGEILEEEVLERIPEDLAVDVVVSHTAPTSILEQLDLPPVHTVSRFWDNTPDPSSEVLQEVLERYRPKHWYFGHFHRWAEGEIDGCRWTCLNFFGKEPATTYAWLPEK